MNIKSYQKLIILTLAVITLSLSISARADGFHGGVREALGPLFDAEPEHFKASKHTPPRNRENPANWVHHWNNIAIDASGLDHTPVAPGEIRNFGEQYGPTRSSRAIAIVHIAIFDAINAIDGRYKSYTGLPRVHPPIAMKAPIMKVSIAVAAHDTLAALFPSQAAAFDKQLDDDLDQIKNPRAKTDGIDLEQRAAAAILALRANDGSQHAEPLIGVGYITNDAPGKWRQDPISLVPIAMGAHWGEVNPFVRSSSRQFLAPQPPALGSPEYAAAYDEVKRLGGDGVHTPTERTADQTNTGFFWAYDGTPSLCAPPRLYNQITMQIASLKHTNDVAELARLLALVNVAMADAGIAVWESKYYYDYWRPVTGIRESDAGTGPTGAGDGDGNPATAGDPNFSPLGAPASNLMGPNFTPPFPAYPSGHAGFGGALFQTLRNFYGTDKIAFTFVSDEFNGMTRDNQGNVRPLLPRSFSSLSQAEEENGQSRIYLGIHWKFDKTAGITQGRKVANYVFKKAFTPLH